MKAYLDKHLCISECQMSEYVIRFLAYMHFKVGSKTPAENIVQRLETSLPVMSPADYPVTSVYKLASVSPNLWNTYQKA